LLRSIIDRCGIVGVPLIVVSLFLFSFVIAQVYALLKYGREYSIQYKKLIEPLEGVAVSLGLLGSVSGFIKAFGSFSGQLDPVRLSGGLKEAYFTTLVGLTLSIIGAVSCYLFDMLGCTSPKEVRS